MTDAAPLTAAHEEFIRMRDAAAGPMLLDSLLTPKEWALAQVQRDRRALLATLDAERSRASGSPTDAALPEAIERLRLGVHIAYCTPGTNHLSDESAPCATFAKVYAR